MYWPVPHIHPTAGKVYFDLAENIKGTLIATQTIIVLIGDVRLWL